MLWIFGLKRNYVALLIGACLPAEAWREGRERKVDGLNFRLQTTFFIKP